MAMQVSGKVYRLDANQFDVRCISLRFDSSSEVWLALTIGSGVFELLRPTRFGEHPRRAAIELLEFTGK